MPKQNVSKDGAAEQFDPEFLFAHIKNIKNSEMEEEKLREELVANGRTDFKTDQERQRLLFLNGAFLGNLSDLGSNTPFYIMQNNNCGSVSITGRDCFDLAGLSDIYKKVKDKVDRIEEEYKNLSEYGAALLVAVPHDIINKNMFPARTGGALNKLCYNSSTQRFHCTTDMQFITTEATDVPDKLEFCLAMTTDKYGAMNPESGVKVIPFFAADSEKVKELERKEQELYNEIRQLYAKRSTK